MAKYKDLPMLAFKTPAAWLAWLADNHAEQSGVWIKFAKKASGLASVTYEEGREGAIIYGWIDGLKNRYDDRYYLIRFMPRRPRSKWSVINREIAEQLIKSKKMKAAGQGEVDAAKADGRWAAAP